MSTAQLSSQVDENTYAPDPVFSARELRNVLSRFATGIAVITTHCKTQGPVGMTVNSFSSVSLDPPLVLWSLRKESHHRESFRIGTEFAVNILGQDQHNLASLFASSDKQKFKKAGYSMGSGNNPLLAGCIAHIECQTYDLIEGGDHVIVIGRVIEFRDQPGAPLIFCQGSYHALAEKPNAQDCLGQSKGRY